MSPLVIALFLAIIILALGYAFLVPRSESDFYIGSALEDSEKTTILKVLGVVSREIGYLAPRSVTDSFQKRTNEKTTQLILRSGNPWKLQPQEFIIAKISLTVLWAIVGTLLSLFLQHVIHIDIPFYILALILGVFGWYIPNITYLEAIKTRDLEFKRQLPDALDLLIISLSTGITFGPALRSAIPLMKPGILRSEFRKMSDAIDSGKTLREALDVFALASPNDSITTFVRSVQEATELNVPLLDVLTTRAEASRQEFFAMLQQKTATLESKMMGILTPTLIPALLIIVLAPSLVAISGAI